MKEEAATAAEPHECVLYGKTAKERKRRRQKRKLNQR